MGPWEMLAEAGADDDEDDLAASKPWQDNPLLKPSSGPKPGERPTSMSPSAAGIGSAAVAAKDKERSDLPKGIVNRVPKSASGLAKMGVSPKKYFSDDDPASATQRQLRGGGVKPPRDPAGSISQKPSYPGTVVGQTYSRNGTAKMKSVSWQDKSGERKYGSVQGKPDKADEMVWDGEDWVTPAQYQAKMWSKRMGGKKTESVWLALEKMTSVKPDPNAAKKPPTYLPGVHKPDSPMRPGKKLKPRPAGAPPAPSAEGEVDEAGMNFGRLNRQKNIQRYGTQDRRADNDVAASRLQKAIAAKKQAKAGGAPAPAAPAPGSVPRASLPPKPKTSFAGASSDPDMSNPLMRPSPLDPDKKRELESVLAMDAGSLMECGCGGGAWGAAMEAADKDEPKKPKAKKDAKPEDDGADIGGEGEVAAGELPPEAVAAIRGAIESLESIVSDVDPDGDEFRAGGSEDDL